MQSVPDVPRPAEEQDDEPQAEYDFAGGARGTYAARVHGPERMVTLDPDVAAVFPDSESVNAAVRALVAIVDRRQIA